MMRQNVPSFMPNTLFLSSSVMATPHVKHGAGIVRAACTDRVFQYIHKCITLATTCGIGSTKRFEEVTNETAADRRGSSDDLRCDGGPPRGLRCFRAECPTVPRKFVSNCKTAGDMHFICNTSGTLVRRYSNDVHQKDSTARAVFNIFLAACVLHT